MLFGAFVSYDFGSCMFFVMMYFVLVHLQPVPLHDHSLPLVPAPAAHPTLTTWGGCSHFKDVRLSLCLHAYNLPACSLSATYR